MNVKASYEEYRAVTITKFKAVSGYNPQKDSNQEKRLKEAIKQLSIFWLTIGLEKNIKENSAYIKGFKEGYKKAAVEAAQGKRQGFTQAN